MNRFVIEQVDGERWIVKDNLQGWFIPVDSERQAEFIKERFESVVTINSKPLTIEDYFTEWEQSINELSQKEIELINLKEIYAEKEQEIIQTTDFKELYGANNEKVRKNHIKRTLSAMTDAKNDLEISIDYLKRRIEFIRGLMKMQGILLESGVLDD